LKQSKGTGASGSFKIGEVVKPKKKPAAKPKAVKPKNAKTPKNTAAKKPAFDIFLFSVLEKREKIWHWDKA
jgi:hypothetical protein